jgi:hypothetical protein
MAAAALLLALHAGAQQQPVPNNALAMGGNTLVLGMTNVEVMESLRMKGDYVNAGKAGTPPPDGVHQVVNQDEQMSDASTPYPPFRAEMGNVGFKDAKLTYIQSYLKDGPEYFDDLSTLIETLTPANGQSCAIVTGATPSLRCKEQTFAISHPPAVRDTISGAFDRLLKSGQRACRIEVNLSGEGCRKNEEDCKDKSVFLHCGQKTIEVNAYDSGFQGRNGEQKLGSISEERGAR